MASLRSSSRASIRRPVRSGWVMRPRRSRARDKVTPATNRFSPLDDQDHTQPDIGVAAILRKPCPDGGAEIFRRTEKGAAAADSKFALGGTGRSGGGGAAFATFHPLADIAQHVVQAERIGLERSDRRGEGKTVVAGRYLAESIAVFALEARIAGIGGPAGLFDPVAPETRCPGAGARRIFQLGFRRHAIAMRAEERHTRDE